VSNKKAVNARRSKVFYRTGQRYGAAYLIEILRGNANATVMERGHAGLSVFGIGRALTDLEWRSLFRQLAALGRISGIGENKLRRFGERLLALVNDE
jgi:superfamily II DNA helicase RecQ